MSKEFKELWLITKGIFTVNHIPVCLANGYWMRALQDNHKALNNSTVESIVSPLTSDVSMIFYLSL